MHACIAREGQMRITLTCGKCGSKAIVSDNQHNKQHTHVVRALKCLICGNRQEKGAPCRWPFFEEGTGRSAMHGETRDEVVGASLNQGVDLSDEPLRIKKRRKKTDPKIVERGLSL